MSNEPCRTDLVFVRTSRPSVGLSKATGFGVIGAKDYIPGVVSKVT